MKLKICRAYASLKLVFFVVVVMVQLSGSFPDITHIKLKNGCKSDILNLIKLTFFRVYPSLKPQILFHMVQLYGTKILRILVMIDDLPFCPPCPSFSPMHILFRAIGEIDTWYKFWNDT